MKNNPTEVRIKNNPFEGAGVCTARAPESKTGAALFMSPSNWRVWEPGQADAPLAPKLP
ncbi:hypothetical protein PCASD_14111 [Puccinia coronata f. sp. avenae]|uniref:Uncharacterized protein n=1 Tax=Puccinia coronata f. sp. avenae TaxID=200324 RepID=A0A2N5U743_9BASI|nr:hypothetical protein PCASD_14111 [Puccinia coronata f. sp. avenae]